MYAFRFRDFYSYWFLLVLGVDWMFVCFYMIVFAFDFLVVI